VHAGLCSSGDAFYATKPAGFTEMLHGAGVVAGEMECAALFIIGAVRGWRVGGILAIDGNIWKRLRKTPGTEDQFRAAEQREIAIAIRAAVLLAAADAGSPR
jgi:uridine phosphorylase